MYQHAVARTDVGQVQDLEGGEPPQHQGRCRCRGHPDRDRHRRFRTDQRVVGVATDLHQGRDTRAERGRRDARPDLVDHPDQVVAERQRRRRTR